jgi:hypothetical protein
MFTRSRRSMSEATITSETTRQIELQGVVLSESEIRYAVYTKYFPQAADDSFQVAATQEIVAQLFDALEEKRSEEKEPTRLILVEAVGSAAALELGRLAEFLDVDHNSVDAAITEIEGLTEALDDERATTTVLEGEVDLLGDFILTNGYGDSSLSGGACATAIRLIGASKSVYKVLNEILSALKIELRDAEVSLDVRQNIETRHREEIEALKAELELYKGKPLAGTKLVSGGKSLLANTTGSLPQSFTITDGVPKPYKAERSGDVWSKPASDYFSPGGSSPVHDCDCIRCSKRRDEEKQENAQQAA